MPHAHEGDGSHEVYQKGKRSLGFKKTDRKKKNTDKAVGCIKVVFFSLCFFFLVFIIECETQEHGAHRR
jgi:hypothetical protein